jgi:transposase InsO family protein
MDNGASFIGDVIHPRHFSRVVRLCLHLGVEPVFIAPRKPWMNGKIEGNNCDFGEKLWEREQFRNPEHIRGEAKTFLMRHNTSSGLEVQEDRSGDYAAT